jgi:hypothetical protein
LRPAAPGEGRVRDTLPRGDRAGAARFERSCWASTRPAPGVNQHSGAGGETSQPGRLGGRPTSPLQFLCRRCTAAVRQHGTANRVVPPRRSRTGKRVERPV